MVYCAATKQFVLWCHLDVSERAATDSWANYVFRRAGVAVSAAGPRGPFRPLRALRPNGRESLDLNLFVDRGEVPRARALFETSPRCSVFHRAAQRHFQVAAPPPVTDPGLSLSR